MPFLEACPCIRFLLLPVLPAHTETLVARPSMLIHRLCLSGINEDMTSSVSKAGTKLVRNSQQVAYLCRAGLYKQMAELKALVSEYREHPSANAALKVRLHAALASLDMHPAAPADGAA